jgi:tetratricopeptide (TPR) repeat protein
MLTDVQWTQLKTENPAFLERVRRDLEDLAQGRCGWAEVLRIGDEELLGMARLAAAKLEHGHATEAERVFLALTELDPFVPWFWMALGDARSRQGRLREAVECYGRCIDEASRIRPPSKDEIRSASLRRGKLQVRMQDPNAALGDFTRVLELDNGAVPDAEQAWLAIQALVAEGKLPEARLHSLPGRWRSRT